MSLYSKLRKLGGENIAKILKAFNATPASSYFTNVATVRDLLSEYNGPVNVNAILHYINSNDVDEEFNRLNAIQLPQTRTKKSHEERYTNYMNNKKAFDEEFERLLSIQLPSTRLQQSHEERYQRYIEKNASEGKKQIDDALNTISKLNDPKTDKKIEFNIAIMNNASKQYFNDHIGEVLLKLISKITYTQSWLCYYKFKGADENVRMKILHEINAGELLRQIHTEHFISEVEAEASGVVEENYDFFPGQIRNLVEISFYDINQYANKAEGEAKFNRYMQKQAEKKEEENDPVLEALKASNQPQAVIDAYLATKKQAQKATTKAPAKKKQYKTVEGSFWKYTLKLPINLERYQIFNEVNKETAAKMTVNNCLVYACIQAGVDRDTVNYMKDTIITRTFPQSKLQTVANETHIKFNVSIRYLDEDFNTTDARTTNRTYTPEDGNVKYDINLVLIDGHYMLNEKVPVSTFFVEHYNDIVKRHPDWSIDRMKLVKEYDATRDRYKIKNNTSTEIGKLIRTLYQCGYFEPITIGDIATYSSIIYKQKLPKITRLEYDEKYCCRLKEDPEVSKAKHQQMVNEKRLAKGLPPIDFSKKKAVKRTETFTLEHVVYADFECSTDGIHNAFNICYQSADGSLKGSFWGPDCAIKFLDILETNTLVYYHNLSYDINFIIRHLTSIFNNPIIKGSRTMTMMGKYASVNEDVAGDYNNKTLCFKDSYSIISAPLERFPVMFKLGTGAKDVFPYKYYSSTLLANDNKVGNIIEASKYSKDPELFIHNVNSIEGCKLNDEEFDMEVYSNYYCMQDVNILRQGFEKFRGDLLREFKLDAYNFISISSIADGYMERNVYWKNGNLYDLANTPREFISRCVQGGRCMLADNEKQLNVNTNEDIDDFDAVSLYPSAIARLYCVEGKPKVLTPEMCNVNYLLKHLFREGQSKPTKQRFISSFYVEAEIKHIGKERHMPLIVVNPEFNNGMEVARSSNTCCTMYVDHITLQDLIEFQQCEIEVKRGYYYDGNRDYTIRDVVQKLFELRLKYKKEDNPLQEVIKLILNSIYGKTILKPIETKIRIVKNEDALRFIRKNYNSIADIEPLYNGNFTIFKQYKPIVRHFNFCPLGVNILSMSKRIMNEVFCTAEDNNIKIFYQDTDSGHYYRKDLPVLAQLFKEKYGRDLVGKNLGQFHSDFAEVVKGKESHACNSIFVGKKTYIDQLYATNDEGKIEIGFHCRMKGVKQDVITITANEMFPDAVQCVYDKAKGLHVPIGPYDANSEFSVMKIYKALYDGQSIAFDLCKGSNPCFERKNNFSIVTKTSFVRNLKF